MNERFGKHDAWDHDAWVRWPRILLTAVAAVVVAASAYLFVAGSTLDVRSSMPTRLDVVFTFTGGSPWRNLWSRELAYRYNALWIIGPPEEALRRDRAGSAIFASAEIIPAEHSTFGEALALRRYLDGRGDLQGTLDIALVSEAYHMRRLKLVTERVFSKSGHRLHYSPIPSSVDRHNWRQKIRQGWWRSAALRREVLKNLYYVLYGYKLPFGHQD